MSQYKIHPMENFYPPKEITAMEMDVIPPGTHVNAYEAYDIEAAPMARYFKQDTLSIFLHLS